MSQQIINQLTFKQKLSWCNHLWKALAFQHHQNLTIPFKRFISPDAVILDIGAHAGQFSKLFAKIAPNGTIYAFEPGSYARSILQKTVSIKGLKNVSIMPYASGSKSGQFTLNIPIKASGSLGFGLSYVGENPANTRPTVSEDITVKTLDALFPDTHIDFIKADIEGHEYDMLLGAKHILERSRPTLYLEINHGKEKTKMQSLLKEYGYQAHDIPSGQPYSWDEFLKKRTENNYLFVVPSPTPTTPTNAPAQ